MPYEPWRNTMLEILHVPRPLPALNAEQHGHFQAEPGVVVERVSYSTQLGMRVPAIVYRPETAAGRRPALIVVNGHGGDKYAWYANYSGVAYARLGFVVLTYDPAGEGERNSERKSGTRAHDRVVPPEENGRWLGGLMMTDVMMAVSYLSSRDDVDSSRISAAGYSMGSFVLSLACAVETRLRACVLVGGGNLDGPGEYWDRSKPMCQGIPYRSLAFLGDRPAAIYAMHAQRGRTLIYNGSEDTVVAIPTHREDFFADLRKRVVALRGGPENVFETQFVEGASHRPYFVTKPVALWLAQALALPAETIEKVRALPQTRIAGWAAENSVSLDPLYATYDREGGTLAIGSGVPALSREQLSVYDEPAWQKNRNRLVHEAWLEKVPR
jgi:dienelactone hydrolase